MPDTTDNQEPQLYTASVKVMRSHDYCHFEVQLGSTDLIDRAGVDAMRKEAARMADKAVEQYKVAKLAAAMKEKWSQPWMLRLARDKEEGDRTPEDKAIIKFADDEAFHSRFSYDYQDDWSNEYSED